MKLPIHSSLHIFLTTLIPLSMLSSFAEAVSFPVTTNADSGAGSFRQAIIDVNAGGGADTIDFDNGLGAIVLMTPLPPITEPTTINGPAMGGQTVDGQGSFSVFYIPSSVGTITINGNSGFLIQGARGIGGQGAGADMTFQAGTGGGGGLGSGGGLTTHASNTIIMTNVSFENGVAVGGQAGTAGESTALDGRYGGGGGGGHNGGSGGREGNDSPNVFGGGGGGGDPVSFPVVNDGSAGIPDGTGDGGDGGAGGTGGLVVDMVNGSGGGGGGGNGVNGANGVAATTTGAGGAGGGTGGGGGASINATTGGNGGIGAFGGGGGGGGGAVGLGLDPSGNGGNGGFGGGGGGIAAGVTMNGTPGTSQFGGGAGGDIFTGGLNAVNAGGGGGGAGFGGAIFIRDGSTVTIADTMAVTIDFMNNSAIGGSPGSGAGLAGLPGESGLGLGQDIFLMTGGSLVFDINNNVSIACIESDNGAGGGVGGDITKLGPATLIIETGTTTNAYTGQYVVTAGTLQGNTSTLVGPITDNAAVTFNQLGMGIFNPAITGTGTLTKIGAGAVDLTAVNTYGGGTIISAGTLTVSGSIVGNVNLDMSGAIFDVANSLSIADLNSVAGSTITLGASNTLTVTTTMADLVAGVIEGDGALTKAGVNTLTLSNTNTYTGLTTINGGTFEVTGSIVGPVTVNMAGAAFNANNTFTMGDLNSVAGSTVSIGNTRTLTVTTSMADLVAGVIQGLGGLQVIGTNVLTASGANTYSGGTTVNGGTYQVTGSIVGDVDILTAGATFDVQNTFTIGDLRGDPGSIVNIGGGDVLTVTTSTIRTVDLIQGAGGLTVTGASTLSLNQGTYTGGTIINGGTLSVFGSLVGPVNVNMAGATFQVLNSFTIGDLTSVAGGIIDLATGGGVLAVTTSMVDAVAGVIQGVGGLTIQGTSTLIASAANTYEGQTTVSGGTFQVTGSIISPVDVATAGAIFDVQNSFTINNLTGVAGGIVNLGAGDVLTLSPGSGTFAGTIQGTGSLVKAGGGTTTLSGINTYSGTTTVSGGTLRVNGSLTNSTTTVNAGGNLSGTGTVQTVINNGKVSPGGSIGTLNIVGNYTQNPGSSLEIELNPIAADLLNITGTATINPGATLELRPTFGSYAAGTSFIVLQAASVTGTFSTVTTTNPAAAFQVIYNPTNIQLLLGSAVIVTGFESILAGRGGIGANEIAICFDNAVATEGSDLFDVLLALSSLGTDQKALIKAFKQMEPNLFGALALAQENNSERIRNTISHRIQDMHLLTCRDPWLEQNDEEDNDDIRLPYSNPKNHYWVEPFGDFGKQSHTPNQNGYHANSVGLATGYDYEFSHNLYVGGMLGYTHTHLKWTNEAGRGNLNSIYGGMYGFWSNQRFRVDVAFLAGWTGYDASRKIEFSTIERTAKNDHGGYELISTVGAEYDIPVSKNHVVPFARLDYVFLHQSQFKEHGAKSLNLNVQDKSYDLLRTEVGLSWYGCFERQDVKFIPEAKLSYVNESRFNNRQLQASFFDELECGFTSNILNPQRNMVAPGLGLTIYFTEIDFDFAVRYEAEIEQSNYWDQEVSVHLNKQF